MSEYKIGDKVLVEAEIVHIDNGEWFPYCLECGGKNFSTDRIWPIPIKTYEDGLNEAWELAKRIVFYEKRGGFSTSQLEEIFGTSDFNDILDNHTAQEAAAKIAEWEARQNIQVRDQVRLNDTDKIGVVLKICSALNRNIGKIYSYTNGALTLASGVNQNVSLDVEPGIYVFSVNAKFLLSSTVGERTIFFTDNVNCMAATGGYGGYSALSLSRIENVKEAKRFSVSIRQSSGQTVQAAVIFTAVRIK